MRGSVRLTRLRGNGSENTTASTAAKVAVRRAAGAGRRSRHQRPRHCPTIQAPPATAGLFCLRLIRNRRSPLMFRRSRPDRLRRCFLLRFLFAAFRLTMARSRFSFVNPHFSAARRALFGRTDAMALGKTTGCPNARKKFIPFKCPPGYRADC